MAKIISRTQSSSERASWQILLNASGDERLALWGEVFSRLQPRLEVFVHFRMSPSLRRRWPVEDVIQYTYLTAWRRIDTFHDGRNDGLYRWLVSIAYRLLGSIKRNEFVRRTEKRSSELKGAESSTAGGVSRFALAQSAERVSRMVMRHEETNRALQALESLSDGDREAILQRVFEGLPFKEMGQRFGVSESAARKRYQRALERLRSSHGFVEELFQ